MPEAKRSVRVGERLREELAVLVAREVRDPRVHGATISEVVMTDDLQLAKVRVRLPPQMPDEPAARRALLAGLQSASGMLRRELGTRLGLRYAPKLAFYYDEAPEKRTRIDELLHEISQTPRAPDDADEEPQK